VSNTNNYIITTLSSGSKEWEDECGNSIQAPFSVGLPTTRALRLTGAPYVSTLGNASSTFTRQILSAGGQTGVPDTVTEAANLKHWWKLSEGTSTSNDNGKSGATATQMTFTNTTFATGGPSAIGTPSYSVFNGIDGYGKVTVVDTSNNDSNINTIFAAGNFSVCFWLKNLTSSAEGAADAIFNATSQDGGLGSNNGVGTWYRTYSSDWYTFIGDGNNGQVGDFMTGSNAGWATTAESYAAWVHCAMVVDNDAAELRTYIDGELRMTRGIVGTVNAKLGPNTGNHGSYMILGGSPTNAANAALSVGRFSNVGIVDFRIYDTVLSLSNLSSITSGDWQDVC
jgi:hypothetical protein